VKLFSMCNTHHTITCFAARDARLREPRNYEGNVKW
jgi:hypothetical protein